MNRDQQNKHVTDLEALLRQAPAAIAVVSGPEHRFTLANALYQRVFGRTEAQLLNKTILEAFPETFDQAFHDLFRSAFESGEARGANEYELIFDRTGRGVLEKSYYDFVAQPIKNSAGNVTDIFIHAYEVTEQVLARHQLELNEEKYRSLFEEMDQGFCILEMIFDDHNNPVDYRFLEINPTFEAQTGLKDAAGKTARELVPDLEAHWFEIYGGVALSGNPSRFIDGSDAMGRWFDVYAFRIGGETSRRVALLFTDISERRKAEAEVARLFDAERRARQEAENANRAKSTFLAMISHELRTPLTSIKGFASTMLAKDVHLEAEEQRRFIEIIEEEADKLRGLIDELLDLSSLQRGVFTITPTSFSLAEVLRELEPQLRVMSQNRSLVFLIPDDLPAVFADKGRLVQVVTNLVVNSAKYSAVETVISISAQAQPGWVEIQVADQGAGIPLDKQDTVFEAFIQLENATAGVGLGLAICKGIIEAHGGRIWIVNKPAPGTTIAFTLPTANK